jgi:GT2 family glycosyltransferase
VCQCLLAHRSVFDAVGRFDESKRLGEDIEWFTRADRAGVVKQILTDVLVHRRIHVESITFEIYRSEKMRSHLMDNVIENLKYRRARAAK